MSNGCPVCGGLGRVLAFGACNEPVAVPCPECAGLAITPASADDAWLRSYSVAKITALLLGRWPELPVPALPGLVQAVDELAEPSVGGSVEVHP
jgi:hypothetical protein